MNEIEFNLLDEPWIRVMADDCKIKEVSLMNVILDAHKYKSLCGELPTQDIAVMRLILAVLHTVFSRYDENGDEAQLEDDEDEALDRWKALWEKGCFSEKAVRGYLEQWHERFWLFHPERPFYQITEKDIMRQITNQKIIKMPKLNGEISQSDNKVNLFSSFFGHEKDALSYSKAARWLVFLNSFDDSSLKPQGENLPSATMAWLGQLGIVYLLGNNLFETLMLNMVIINNGEVETNQVPIWEKESIRVSERVEVVLPDNLAELYTLQSRRVHLFRESGYVSSFHNLAGDLVLCENAFEEPMTIWEVPKKASDAYKPKIHDPSKQMWREFSVLYNEEKNHRAGVISWYKNYVQLCIKSSDVLKTTIVSVNYDSSSSHKVVNTFSDSLTMHSGLLSELGRNWRNDIENEIKKCDELAYAFAVFSKELYLASGGSNSSKDKHCENIQYDAKAQIYYRLDLPFRKWLREIVPDCSGEDKQCKLKEWKICAKSIALNCMYELASDVSESALIGHSIEAKDKKKKELYSAPRAIHIFKGKVNKIYGKAGD